MKIWEDEHQSWVRDGDGREITGKKRLSGCTKSMLTPKLTPVRYVLPVDVLRTCFTDDCITLDADYNLAKKECIAREE